MKTQETKLSGVNKMAGRQIKGLRLTLRSLFEIPAREGSTILCLQILYTPANCRVNPVCNLPAKADALVDTHVWKMP